MRRRCREGLMGMGAKFEWAGLPAFYAERIIPEPNSGCWLWLGADTTRNGLTYGRPRYAGARSGANCGAHRVIYEELIGRIPEGLELDHRCRTPLCVNPAHLEPTTHRENILRGVGVAARNAAKTHCPQGHPLTPGNLVLSRRDGKRACLICHRRAVRDAGRRQRGWHD